MHMTQQRQPTLEDALDALDALQARIPDDSDGLDLSSLATARHVLRRMSLTLARASGCLKATLGLTETGRQIVVEILAIIPSLRETPTPILAEIVEEKPVPGPTPNAKEDKVQG